MIINASDSEEQMKTKRVINEIEMAHSHVLGSLCLPTGIPIDCQVDQPKDQPVNILTYKTGDTQFCNGEVRNRYLNGKNRYEFAFGFAGRARNQAEMNSGETVADPKWNRDVIL